MVFSSRYRMLTEFSVISLFSFKSISELLTLQHNSIVFLTEEQILILFCMKLDVTKNACKAYHCSKELDK